MTEHKFTDEDIIDSLRYHASHALARCCQCAYLECYENCTEMLAKDALDLIVRQKAEIEGLREKQVEDEQLLNLRVIESVNAVSEAHRKYERALEEHLKTERAEAIKEFAERLKHIIGFDDLVPTDCVMLFPYINNLVKELTEEQK